jgi:LPS export ABC transporter protein LptC
VRNLLPLVMVGLVTVTLWWLFNADEEHPPDPSIFTAADKAAENGGMALDQVRIIQKRENRTLFELLAGSAAMTEDESETRLTGFSLLAHPTGAPPLTLAAETGTLGKERSEVTAHGRVVVYDGAGRGVLTDSLTMQDNGRKIVTDAPVRIYGPSFVIFGKGMVAYPDEETVELVSDVTAVFMPEDR